MVLAKAVVEAEGPLVVQAAPADETLSAPSPPPAAPERLPGGSPNAPPVSEPPAEGTTDEPSTTERMPEETVGGSPGQSPSRPSGVLVVARTPPCGVPEANVLVGSSADQGEFDDELEDDAEMATFKELVSVSPSCFFISSFCVCSDPSFWLNRKWSRLVLRPKLNFGLFMRRTGCSGSRTWS